MPRDAEEILNIGAAHPGHYNNLSQHASLQQHLCVCYLLQHITNTNLRSLAVML